MRIDLYTKVLNWKEFRELQLAFLRASTPDSEIPTDHAIVAAFYEASSRYRIMAPTGRVATMDLATRLSRAPRMRAWSALESITMRPLGKLLASKWTWWDADDLEWLQGWCTVLREAVSAGKLVRRARIISEPLSDYQRWSYGIAQSMVDAGEDIRWVPRRLVSSVAIPGNDFYLVDNRLVVFLTYSGSGLDAGKFTSSDPADIQLCRSSFDAPQRCAAEPFSAGPRPGAPRRRACPCR